MKQRTLIVALVAVGLAAAGGYGPYTIGVSQGMKMAAPAPLAATGGSQDRKVLYWHDPMSRARSSTSRASRLSWTCSVVCAPSSLSPPLHAYLGIVAEPRGAILLAY